MSKRRLGEALARPGDLGKDGMLVIWICLCAAVAIAAAGIVYPIVMHPAALKTGNGKNRIACVGDSITYGLGVLGRRRKWSYPALLIRELGEDYAALNYGLSDRTLLSTADKPYFMERLGRNAWDTDADIVILMLGSNDCKRKNWNGKQFEREYEKVVRHYRQKDGRRLLLAIPPKIFITKAGKNGYDDGILERELAPAVRRLAEKYAVECVDLYRLTRDHPNWYADRLHPNRAGNMAIAEKIALQIRARA